MMRPLLLAAMALQASASEDNAVPVTWRKIANHYCSPRVDLKTYTTAAAAMRACAQDRRCLAISDSGCNGYGNWVTCRSKLGTYSRERSCMYAKPSQSANKGHRERGRQCYDGKDNDHDGRKDCDDPDCKRMAKCRHVGGKETGRMCWDGKDNDHDGKSDCDDSDCRKDPRARYHCLHTETGRECFDGRDNDHDGRKDCDDPDCQRTVGKCKHHKSGKEYGVLCFDHKDNDGDGRADCDDSDCRKDPRAKFHCMHTETGRECHNGRDDDHDGLPDCKDPDCASVCKSGGRHGRERGRQCYDGKDNDGDGKKDCADPDCKRISKCRHKGGKETGKLCFDHKDNDHDGRTDCDDSDCLRDPRAYWMCLKTETGRECFDGKDNDHDGKKDCQDPDCLKDRRIQQRCRMHGGNATAGVGWAKVAHHYCAANQDFNLHYRTMAAAQKACSANWQCKGVSDAGCDGKGMFVTCRTFPGSASRAGSCIYKKPGH